MTTSDGRVQTRLTLARVPPDSITDGRFTYADMGIPRRVSVRGVEGVTTTVVVRTYRGLVWMSISPPFTWEAIMTPGTVDQVIHALELARDEAKLRLT